MAGLLVCRCRTRRRVPGPGSGRGSAFTGRRTSSGGWVVQLTDSPLDLDKPRPPGRSPAGL
ncbi:DUF5953 family protein [Pyxidicoccus trucidator]|uniref:DUF5953 family protein n=1 Tax=Pyxidicoccus trucidator TaxID=2709662 RepID=UPI003B838387